MQAHAARFSIHLSQALSTRTFRGTHHLRSRTLCYTRMASPKEIPAYPRQNHPQSVQEIRSRTQLVDGS